MQLFLEKSNYFKSYVGNNKILKFCLLVLVVSHNTICVKGWLQETDVSQWYALGYGFILKKSSVCTQEFDSNMKILVLVVNSVVLYVTLLLYESAQSVHCNQNKTFNGFCVILLLKKRQLPAPLLCFDAVCSCYTVDNGSLSITNQHTEYHSNIIKLMTRHNPS